MSITPSSANSSNKGPSYAEMRAQNRLNSGNNQAISTIANLFGGVPDEVTINNAYAMATQGLSPSSLSYKSGLSINEQKTELQTLANQAVSSGDIETALAALFRLNQVKEAGLQVSKKTRDFFLNIVKPADVKYKPPKPPDDSEYYEALGYGEE